MISIAVPKHSKSRTKSNLWLVFAYLIFKSENQIFYSTTEDKNLLRNCPSSSRAACRPSPFRDCTDSRSFGFSCGTLSRSTNPGFRNSSFQSIVLGNSPHRFAVAPSSFFVRGLRHPPFCPSCARASAVDGFDPLSVCRDMEDVWDTPWAPGPIAGLPASKRFRHRDLPDGFERTCGFRQRWGAR